MQIAQNARGRASDLSEVTRDNVPSAVQDRETRSSTVRIEQLPRTTAQPPDSSENVDQLHRLLTTARPSISGEEREPIHNGLTVLQWHPIRMVELPSVPFPFLRKRPV